MTDQHSDEAAPAPMTGDAVTDHDFDDTELRAQPQRSGHRIWIPLRSVWSGITIMIYG